MNTGISLGFNSWKGSSWDISPPKTSLESKEGCKVWTDGRLYAVENLVVLSKLFQRARFYLKPQEVW